MDKDGDGEGERVGWDEREWDRGGKEMGIGMGWDGEREEVGDMDGDRMG